MPAARVVSLVPSVTETLLAWGVTPVAVTRFCEQPDLRTVGGTKDPQCSEIVALRPDLVVMCDQENRREDAEALRSAGLNVHALHITRVEHVGPQLRALADAVGASEAAACGLPDSIDLGPSPAGACRRAFVPIWRRPYMTISGDTYASTLLRAIGVENVAADWPDRYPEFDLAAAKGLEPDLVVAPSEPYPFSQRHVAELSAVAPVVLVDGRDLFWWGVRTCAAAHRLKAVLV